MFWLPPWHPLVMIFGCLTGAPFYSFFGCLTGAPLYSFFGSLPGAPLCSCFGSLPGVPLCSFLAASLVPPFTHFLALSLVPPLEFMFWLPPWCSLVLIFWLPPWCYTFYYLPAWHIWNKVVWLYSQTGKLGTVISPVKSILWCWYLKLKSCLPWGGHAGWTYDLMCSNNILGLASCWSYTWWNRSWNSRFWSWKIISWYCQYCFSSRLSMFC